MYPVIKSIIRRILQLKLRYPGTKVMLDISDVAGAFTLVDINENCVDEFAADMPMGVGDDVRVPTAEEMLTPSSSPETAGIIKQARAAAESLAVAMRRHKKKSAVAALLTVVYLTGTFGSVSLPPSYGKVAMKPISDYHNAFIVACPLWHGTEAFSSWTYVDDTIDVTADWGLRRWVSRHTLMEGFFAFLGVNAFNVSKASAGYATDIIGWGLGLDTVSERAYYSAPRVKRLRGQALGRRVRPRLQGRGQLQETGLAPWFHAEHAGGAPLRTRALPRSLAHAGDRRPLSVHGEATRRRSDGEARMGAVS